MNVYELWVWIAIGLLPHKIVYEIHGTIRRLELRALFWTFTIQRGYQGREWTLTVSLIERLQDALWTIVDWLAKQKRQP